MLDSKMLYTLQSNASVGRVKVLSSRVLFSDYLESCRKFIQDNKTQEYTSDITPERKLALQEDMILRFINAHNVEVEGFVENGVVNEQKLFSTLVDSISGDSILRSAFSDDDIDEVQINDPNSIFVVHRGVTRPYVDDEGKPLQFSSDTETVVLLNHLIDDGTGRAPDMNEAKPLLNAKTFKHGYRVASVHESVNTRDSYPFDGPATSSTIRKFKEVKLTLEQLIASGMMTEQMGRFIKLCGRSDARILLVGKTGSGKTTTLNIIAQQLGDGKRTILIQDPTEIRLFERDEFGRNKFNALHWEANANATIADLLAHALRSTPDAILVGEVRTPQAFGELYRAFKFGERGMSTFHAGGVVEAVHRFADEVASSGYASLESAYKGICRDVDLIIYQHKFFDGKRKLLEVGEIVGYDSSKGEPVVNMLFEYVQTGTTVGSDGEFVQHNMMTDALRKRFLRMGISAEELAEF